MFSISMEGEHTNSRERRRGLLEVVLPLPPLIIQPTHLHQLNAVESLGGLLRMRISASETAVLWHAVQHATAWAMPREHLVHGILLSEFSDRIPCAPQRRRSPCGNISRRATTTSKAPSRCRKPTRDAEKHFNAPRRFPNERFQRTFSLPVKITFPQKTIFIGRRTEQAPRLIRPPKTFWSLSRLTGPHA